MSWMRLVIQIMRTPGLSSNSFSHPLSCVSPRRIQEKSVFRTYSPSAVDKQTDSEYDSILTEEIQ